MIDAPTESGGVREKETHSDKPKKSQSITFRLDSYTIDELQREADQNQISLNVLVNQALRLSSLIQSHLMELIFLKFLL
ncbi:MAG: hypothetical protein WCC17_14680 [Candidatus Nitrosopolaris sp.]